MTTPWIIAFVALWALVMVLGVLVLGTLRRLAPVLERADLSRSDAAELVSPGGLPIGATVPEFSVFRADRAPFTEKSLEGSKTIVLFLSSSCQPCERLVADLRDGDVPDLGVALVVVTDDPDHADALDRAADVTVLAQDDRSLAHVFESKATPHAFVVDEARRVVATGTPNDWGGLRQLLARAERGGDRDPNVAAAAVAS